VNQQEKIGKGEQKRKRRDMNKKGRKWTKSF
jgi:hypothetical protein